MSVAPLTSQEQNKIVQLLGYGSKILQAGSVIYNKILNDRLNNVPDDGINFVRDWLDQVSSIEDQIKAAITRMTAEKVDDITLNKREVEMLRTERKRIAREIAAHLDIPYQGPAQGSMVNLSI